MHICKECGKKEEGNWVEEKKLRLIERQLCFSCDFWYSHYLLKNSKIVARIKGHHYRIGVKTNDPNRWKGMGGSKITIKFNDGRIIHTDNLWHQGEIPERWKERMPDNATFIKEKK